MPAVIADQCVTINGCLAAIVFAAFFYTIDTPYPSARHCAGLRAVQLSGRSRFREIGDDPLLSSRPMWRLASFHTPGTCALAAACFSRIWQFGERISSRISRSLLSLAWRSLHSIWSSGRSGSGAGGVLFRSAGVPSLSALPFAQSYRSRVAYFSAAEKRIAATAESQYLL